MGSFKIQWKRSARKDLKKLGKTVIPRIIHAVESPAENPHLDGSKKLRSTEHTCRVRVGSYRIVYSILADILTIEIIRVGYRKKIYKKLT